MRALAVSLIEREKITTTEAKAKSLRPFVERLVTTGRQGTASSRRLVSSQIGDRSARKIALVLGPKYKSRAGGFTRILKLPKREGDGSRMAVIEFV